MLHYYTNLVGPRGRGHCYNKKYIVYILQVENLFRFNKCRQNETDYREIHVHLYNVHALKKP